MVFGLFKNKKKETSNDNKAVKDSRYLDMTVREVVRVTADAVNVIFEKPEREFTYQPGQFVTLIFTIDGKKVRRAYSLCTTPGVDEYPAVTVKRVEGGLVSNHINDNVKAGDVLEVMEPMGMFTTEYAADNQRHLVMVGGGSGITPLNAILKATLDREPQSKVSLIYANRNQESIIFKDELAKLEAEQKGRFKVVHVLDNAPEGWSGHSGLLNNEKLKGIIGELPKYDSPVTEYYTCGPQPLMDIVFDSLNEMEVPLEFRFRESFVAGNTSPEIAADEEASAPAAATTVKVTVDGEDYEFPVPAGKTILEAGLEADVDMPYSCQSGLCTACRAKCHSGEVTTDDADGLSQNELDEGYVLTCVGKVVSGDISLEIG